jgi:hypothetical protein
MVVQVFFIVESADITKNHKKNAKNHKTSQKKHQKSPNQSLLAKKNVFFFRTGETDCRIVAASGPGMRPRIRSQGACFLGRDDP